MIRIFLFTQLTKHGYSSHDPVFGRFQRRQPHGYDEVRGVTGSG